MKLHKFQYHEFDKDIKYAKGRTVILQFEVQTGEFCLNIYGNNEFQN